MSITPLLEIASSYCLLRGLGLRRPLLTKNMIQHGFARCEMGADAMVHSSISELSTMPAIGHSRRFDRITATFAVGTRVTSRPPHRSVRAQFGHTAPTLGV